ncbi:hypothetical protein [Actinoplanes friuliensis]|uniref:Uncharacterized protein n=1 Tax=Actinoplanes friuliensis DSM 7358 TaxID=1246995 RepID=U5VUQ8_9ACTN|nr:hypothetical protein [Actinoplanes friuliensis]AGZ39470.1 hypothetical protein AFR_05905 [Actinoplanes friuliensis DSM 7358]
MKSRLRRLHLDGRVFTWKGEVRHAGTRRFIRVRAWGAGKNSRPLQADLHERPNQTYPYPTADDVRTLVTHALAAGWTPEAHGAAFVLTNVSLPAFTV